MHPAVHDSSTANELSLKAGIRKRFVQLVLFLLAQAVILLVGAGQLLWMWAWIYLGICAASMIVNGFFLLRSSPETIAERSQVRFTQRWDEVVSVFYSLFHFLLVPLVAALDIRFSWTGELENMWHIVGAIVLMAALALSGWAVIVNAYSSTTVRIQNHSADHAYQRPVPDGILTLAHSLRL